LIPVLLAGAKTGRKRATETSALEPGRRYFEWVHKAGEGLPERIFVFLAYRYIKKDIGIKRLSKRRKVMSTRRVLLFFVCIGVLCCTALINPANVLADVQGLEAIVEILEQKGLLSADEARAVRNKISSHQQAAQALEQTEPDAGPASSPVAGFPPCLEDGQGDFSLCFSGLVQADYRAFDYGLKPAGYTQEPGKNRFDIRRAQIGLYGDATKFFSYRFLFEFQGAGSRRLLDAYAQANIHPAFGLRMGQFKEPFGLEASSSDSNLFFAEKSMNAHLGPGRDVGLMAHGAFFGKKASYAIGVFNGDGEDDTVGGNVDEPEITARLTAMPFAGSSMKALENLHLGASGSWIRADANNVRVNVSTAGLTPFFTVLTRAKFNIIRGCDSAWRAGAEAFWSYGPLAVYGEYAKKTYTNVKTSANLFDIELTGGFASATYMLTGEQQTVKSNSIAAVTPLRPLGQGGWGAMGIGVRHDRFVTGKNVYDVLINAGDSVREAKAWTFAVNWYPTKNTRLLLDLTQTSFDRPLMIFRDPVIGASFYSKDETVLSSRFQLSF